MRAALLLRAVCVLRDVQRVRQDAVDSDRRAGLGGDLLAMVQQQGSPPVAQIRWSNAALPCLGRGALTARDVDR